jgi:steroid 5-alpha reductase family enzyme
VAHVRSIRHPNYFGEQLWWWALSLFSVYVGQWYMVAGTLINSLCLATVTLMVEQRMLERPERKQAFFEYQRTTSVLVPWFKGSATTASTTKKRN